MVIIYTDNGYQKWYSTNEMLKKKRLNFIIRGSIVATLLFILVLILNIVGNNIILVSMYIFLIIIIVSISFIKYKHKEFIPCCNNCGCQIKNVNDDCLIGKTKLLGMKGKTVYSKIIINNKTSGSQNNSKVVSTPTIENVYVYNIEYMCKNCGAFYIKLKKETEEPVYGNYTKS